MVLSTLPDLPGRTFQVVGFVYGQEQLRKINQIIATMTQQAQQMGANGIVNIQISSCANQGMPELFGTGTAVLIR